MSYEELYISNARLSCCGEVPGFPEPEPEPIPEPEPEPILNPLLAVGMGEYVTSFLKDDGTVKCASQATWPPQMADYGLTDIVGLGGGQYHVAAWDEEGRVFILGNSANYSEVTLDENDDPFTGNTFVMPVYQCNASIRAGEVWYWGIGDALNQNSGSTITKPIKLTQPPGKTIVKLDATGDTGFGNVVLWGLASDGTLWQWDRSNTTPFQVTISGKTIKDIAMVGPHAYVVITEDDKIYAWGTWSMYAGTVSHTGSTKTDVTSIWQTAGVVFPIKQIAGNYNTLHIIDANDNLFASGCNTMGEIGNNDGFKHWRTSIAPYSWGFGNDENMVTPVQIPGKYQNLQKGNTIAFYLYVQDKGGNWYSWGRNKATSLGNGITLAPSGGDGYDTYPNAQDVHAPTRVDPLNSGTWTEIPFDPDSDRAPLAWAGVNQYLTGVTSTTLTGSSSQQQPTSSGTTYTVTYLWERISGEECTIVNPTSAVTEVNGLSAGEYVFRLTCTSSNSLTSYQDVKITIE